MHTCAHLEVKTVYKVCIPKVHNAFQHGKKVGNFGNGESFSMSPTKVLTAGEGGLITTNDKKLGEKIRIGRR